MNANPQQEQTGILRAIAWRPTDSEPMQLVDECRVLAKRGLDTENRPHGKREVTLLSAEAWAEVCTELGAELPWHLRRANFLVEGIDLAGTIGKTLSLGEVRIHVHGETKPCGIMDEQHKGLRKALVPDGRGGVYGQVTTEGTVRVGDRVAAAPH